MSKLKISDLSVGDWVMYSGRPKKVGVIDLYKNNTDDARVGFLVYKQSNGWHRVHYHNIEDFAPIPITPEILKKNGEYDSDYEVWRIGKRAVVSPERRKYRVHIYDCHINRTVVVVFAEYVHQLQHALRLAGIDKEIEL